MFHCDVCYEISDDDNYECRCDRMRYREEIARRIKMSPDPVRLEDPDKKYKVPRLRHDLKHQERAWFELGKHVGLIVEDPHDHDFAWVMFWLFDPVKFPGGLYCVANHVSLPTIEAAQAELFDGMKIAHSEDMTRGN
jgi:hypothetical protein